MKHIDNAANRVMRRIIYTCTTVKCNHRVQFKSLFKNIVEKYDIVRAVIVIRIDGSNRTVNWNYIKVCTEALILTETLKIPYHKAMSLHESYKGAQSHCSNANEITHILLPVLSQYSCVSSL